MIEILVNIIMETTGLRRAARNFGANLGERLAEKVVGGIDEATNKYDLDETIDGETPHPKSDHSRKRKPSSSGKMESTILVIVLALIGMVVIAIPVLNCAQKFPNKPKEAKEAKLNTNQTNVDDAAGFQSGTMFLANQPGMPLNLSKTLQEGKTTILYFHSDKCQYCREMEDSLIKLAVLRSDVAIAKVDIDRANQMYIDFESPVAYQFSINKVPYFQVYSPARLCIAKGDSARRLVRDMCDKSDAKALAAQ